MQLPIKETTVKRYHESKKFMEYLNLVKSRIKVGQKINIVTEKMVTFDVGGKIPRKAKVIGIYPYFVLVEFGKQICCQESIPWDDVLRWNRNLWEDAQNG